MSQHPLQQKFLSALAKLWVNWLALAGTAIASLAGNALLIVTVVDVVTGRVNPYVSMVGYFGLPALLLFGLALLALGWRRARKAADRGQAPSPAAPRLAVVIGGTILNLTLVSVGAYQGVTHMETATFCGTTCHVMDPEYRAWQRSPHARVACVHCHVGRGAASVFRSKVDGAKRLWTLATGTTAQPIPGGRSAQPQKPRCRDCHWSGVDHGDKLKVFDHFQSDAATTPETNVLRLHVGGRDHRTGNYRGVHWHASPDVQITYELVEQKGKQRVGEVVVEQRGKRTVFRAPKSLAKAKRIGRRQMRCTDCHTRPAHHFARSAERAVDQAIAAGHISRDLPYIRKQALLLVKAGYPDRKNARKAIRSKLTAFYRKHYPDVARAKDKQLQRTAKAVAEVYRRNVFPAMKITWGTYPSQLGHRDSDNSAFGCFRCHDDEHTTAKGKDGEQRSIAQDCDKCHSMLAEEEEKPDLPEGMLDLREP